MSQTGLKKSLRGPTLRVYLRRSHDDHQHHSIDTQREGAMRFVHGTLPGLVGDVEIRWESREE